MIKVNSYPALDNFPDVLGFKRGTITKNQNFYKAPLFLAPLQSPRQKLVDDKAGLSGACSGIEDDTAIFPILVGIPDQTRDEGAFVLRFFQSHNNFSYIINSVTVTHRLRCTRRHWVFFSTNKIGSGMSMMTSVQLFVVRIQYTTLCRNCQGLAMNRYGVVAHFLHTFKNRSSISPIKQKNTPILNELTCICISEWRDSNSRPPAPKAGALPTAQHPGIWRHGCTARV